jgi:hypothetical protein
MNKIKKLMFQDVESTNDQMKRQKTIDKKN